MEQFKERNEQAGDYAARVRATIELVLVLEKKIAQWGIAMEAAAVAEEAECAA